MTERVNERVTAELDGDFVVFRIGMRINSLWKVHRWIPVFRAMPRMLEELEADPERGLLAYDLNLGLRVHEVIQYWRSFEDLRAYALDGTGEHVPAMGSMNSLLEESDAVGIFHETYLITDGNYETVYDTTPPIGLGKAGEIHPATDRRRTAAGRLGVTDGSDVTRADDGARSDPLDAT